MQLTNHHSANGAEQSQNIKALINNLHHKIARYSPVNDAL